MADLNVRGRRVLVRQDLNVPIKDGEVISAARINAALPTLIALLKQGAKVSVMSHLGRPEEGAREPEYSLAPVAKILSEKLSLIVPLVYDWIDGFDQQHDLVLLENVRYLSGEKNNDEILSRKMAALCDIYLMDAFGTAHRAEASTHGVGLFAPEVAAGPLLVSELDALGQILAGPKRPALAIVGGSKVSTKLNALEELANRVDQIIVGGGIANTCLAAAGFHVGKSLIEADLIGTAKKLMAQVNIPLPVDVIVASEFSGDAQAVVKGVANLADDDIILDVGPETQSFYRSMIATAETIFWNGPVGVFEFPQFEGGTRALSLAIAQNKGFSLAGGGDTLAAIEKFGVSNQISYTSTGGGALLEFIEGKDLPALQMLKYRTNL